MLLGTRGVVVTDKVLFCWKTIDARTDVSAADVTHT